MLDYSFEQIRAVLDKKKYTFYTTGLYNLNIVGIRAANSQSDKFDDVMNVIYRADDNRFKHHRFECTTDPGKHWLTNPMNIMGCAIMIPGQYKGAYKVGLHKGYRALEQKAPMWYVRDNNKNMVLDFSLYATVEDRKKNAFWDILKTNIHKASVMADLLHVGMYSAGCQVLRKANDFSTMMTLADKQIANGNGNSFTYTLLEEMDFK